MKLTLAGTPIRFGLVGVANTCVGLAAILLARSLLGAGEVPANALGYACGITVSFVLNRAWTFADRGPVLPAAVRFGVLICCAWLINIACVLALLELGVLAPLAHAAGIAPYTLAVYLGCRGFVFRGGDMAPAGGPPQ